MASEVVSSGRICAGIVRLDIPPFNGGETAVLDDGGSDLDR